VDEGKHYALPAGAFHSGADGTVPPISWNIAVLLIRRACPQLQNTHATDQGSDQSSHRARWQCTWPLCERAVGVQSMQVNVLFVKVLVVVIGQRCLNMACKDLLLAH